MAKFTVANDVKGIKAQITSISRRGKALDYDIQQCALGIIKHVSVHHEVSLINLLVSAMPKGARVNALREFFVKYGKCKYIEETKEFAPVRNEEYVLPTEYENWYDLKPEPTFRPLDLEKQIAALISKAEKALDGEHAELHNIPTETLAALKTLNIK